MWRFQHIEYLWLLLLLPLCVIAYVLYLDWRRQKLAALGEARLVEPQLKGRIAGRSTTRFVLLMGALAFAVVALANLQKGSGTEAAERKGVDVIFALDVSRSMLAEDVSPTRLARARQLIDRIMGDMKNNRVGLIVFAGRAYLQTPLTGDYSALKMMLSSVTPDMLPTQGTVLGQAIDLANESFSDKEKKYKALVLISDGEDHDESAESAASQAAEQGVIIQTVGIGSPEGATLRDPATGKEKLDTDGKPVITKLNEAELQGIAKAGNGGYHHLVNVNKVAASLSEKINDMEGRNLGEVVYTQYKSYYQYFLLVSFLLLIAEWLIPGASLARKVTSTKPQVAS